MLYYEITWVLIAFATFSNISVMDKIILMLVCHFIYNHWTSWHKNWYKHSGSPEDESYNSSNSLTIIPSCKLILIQLSIYKSTKCIGKICSKYSWSPEDES